MQLLAQIEQLKEKTAVWYLGGPSIVIQTHGCIVYVDPFFGPSVNPLWTRRFDPLIEAANIRKADYVLITHEHRDHCNEVTIKALEQHVRPAYFLPRASLEQIHSEYGLYIAEDRVHPVKPGDRFNLPNFELRVFASADQTAKEAVSYFISTRDGKIFHAGDSLYVPSFFSEVKQNEPDLALLPLGENPPGWEVYPNISDFLKMASEIEAKVTVPIHWDLWKESYLNAHRLESRVGKIKIRTIQRGGKIELPLEK
jgi:L-ascorbate metabolism protein UlaG (beta-lactamase superfamily)